MIPYIKDDSLLYITTNNFQLQTFNETLLLETLLQIPEKQ